MGHGRRDEPPEKRWATGKGMSRRRRDGHRRRDGPPENGPLANRENRDWWIKPSVCAHFQNMPYIFIMSLARVREDAYAVFIHHFPFLEKR
jgi:hypothetical protein